MSEPETATTAATTATEPCLCREALHLAREVFGFSPAVALHLRNSRVEFLKAVRAGLDERIEKLSRAPRAGAHVPVE